MKRISFFMAAMLLGIAIALAQGGTTGPLTWELEAGTLIISGEGAMPDYNYKTANYAPWYEYRESIHTVVIETDITTIGNYAFLHCTKVMSITLPNSVTSIKNGAFYYCESLLSITIPDSVIIIGDEAFIACKSLSSITIPSSVTIIGDKAFYYCESLLSIIISGSITTIGNSTFAFCSSLISITIPDSVTSIGNGTFYACTSLVSIIIPNGVTSIGNSAFYYCESLTSISLSNSLATIESSAFSYCTKLTSITIPSSVTTIERLVFLYCTSLTSVIILNGVKSIEDYAFYSCTSLSSITIPGSVISIGSGTFYSCTSLPSVTISSSVKSIGGEAFSNCTSLTSIDVESENNNYASENGVLFNKNKTTLICYPSGKTEASYIISKDVTKIEIGAFSNCMSLVSIDVESKNNSYASENGVLFNKSKTSLIRYPYGKTADKYVIPNCVTTIGVAAFAFCPSLISITIPNSVTNIERSVFWECSSLTSIIIPNSVTAIEYGTFFYCTSLISITIPNSVTKIKDAAFISCPNLTLITNLNPMPTTLSPYAFDDLNQSACTLTVPTSAVSAYQKAAEWNKFNIVGGGILVNPVANNSKYGYTTGDGLYEEYDFVTVTATANTGYRFVKWTKNGVEVSNKALYVFLVTEDIELVANFENEVGIENVEFENIVSIFPNPVSGVVAISAADEIQQLNIFDVTGRLVNSQLPANRQVIFDTGVLPKGIYLVQARLKDGKAQTGKMVVR